MGGEMSGKTVLVTGATGGIGLVTAAELARMGASVVLTARSPEKGEAAASEVKRRSGSMDVEVLYGDLASLAEVREIAKNFLATHDALHVLVNNAGAMHMTRQETRDGFELTLGVNHLAHFYLTNLLLDTLKASARAGSAARIVNVASMGHMGMWIAFDDLQLRRLYVPMFAYGQSKLANILHAFELARRLEGSGVTANALHPGLVATGFGRNESAFAPMMDAAQTFLRPFFLTPEQGAETSIYLASSPEVEGVTGRYFDSRRSIPAWFTAYDQAAARRLWDVSEELVDQASGAG
jgi:NAD(P)-dependent dehydrogenase (short-subunit alcohol dehydrogenase family)